MFIVGANIVRPSIFSYSGKRYPRSHFRNPSGGIARSSLSAWGLQTLLFALSCMYNVGILNICFEYSYCFLYGVCCACFSFAFLCKISHKEFLFFFSLLKRKKEAKKRKALACPCPVRQCITRLAVWSFGDIQQKSPGGVIGSLSAVTLPFLNVKLGRKVSGDPPHLQKRGICGTIKLLID